MANQQEERVSKDFLEKEGWVLVEDAAIPKVPKKVRGEESEPGENVFYRVKEVHDDHSTCEVELASNAESLVEFQKAADITYSSIVAEDVESGTKTGDVPLGVIVVIDDDGQALTPKSRMSSVRVPKQWKHKLVNPTGKPVKLLQKYAPAWNSQSAKYEIKNKLTNSKNIWFELRESLAQTEKGLLYKIKKFKRNKYAKVYTRLDPGVESLVEYHEKSKQVYKVLRGKGEAIIDGKRSSHSFWCCRRIVIRPHQKFQFINKSRKKWTLKLISTPEWTPDDSYYVVPGKDKPIPGSDMWFAALPS